MSESFSKRYRDFVLKDVQSPAYETQAIWLSRIMIVVGLIFVGIYIGSMHDVFVSHMTHIGRLLHIANTTRHPAATFFLYLLSTLLLSAGFIMLVLSYVVCLFWFYDMRQRNRIIQELQARLMAHDSQKLSLPLAP